MGIELKIIPPNPFAEKAATAEGLTPDEMAQAIQWTLDNSPTQGFYTSSDGKLHDIRGVTHVQVEDGVPKLDPIKSVGLDTTYQAAAEVFAKGIVRKHIFPVRPEFDFGSAHKLALGLTPLAGKVSHAALTKTARETSGYGDLRDIDHVEVRGGHRVYPQPLSFPKVPGVSRETLEQFHRMESVDFMPPEKSGMSYEQRLEERKRIINEFALLNPFHSKLYQRRITFKKEFMDVLEIVEDKERMRLRKRTNRRKTTKKRKQRLMGKR